MKEARVNVEACSLAGIATIDVITHDGECFLQIRKRCLA